MCGFVWWGSVDDRALSVVFSVCSAFQWDVCFWVWILCLLLEIGFHVCLGMGIMSSSWA